MIRQNSLISKAWLRLLACVAVSVVVHASLGALGWQSPAATPVPGEQPLTVALIETLPAKAMPAVHPAPQPRRSGSQASPSRPVAAPRSVIPPEISPPAVESACAVTEAPEVEVPVEEADVAYAAVESPGSEGLPLPGPGASSVAAGGAAGSTKRGTGKSDRDEGGALIKATPRYESNPLPHYPRLARQNHWEGTVRLRARVSPGGEVESLSLERSSGHAVLDRSALDGVQRWRFIPATRGGIPVACDVSIPVAFKLRE